MTGYVHSFESLAAVDGEGLRCAVFLSGCPMRCVCCHNPDTWLLKNGIETSPEDMAAKIERYKPYFGIDGGVTFSGGEPLCQAEFINETSEILRCKGITYAVDTSGSVELTSPVKTALENAKFVILDLKFWDEDSYVKYTAHSMKNTLLTLDYLESIGKRVWIRTVIIPGINDTKEHMDKYLIHLRDKTCVEKYELLAFHTMGFFKYDKLSIQNPLENTEPLSQNIRNELQKYINDVFL